MYKGTCQAQLLYPTWMTSVQRNLAGTAVVSSQDDSRVQRYLSGTAVVSSQDDSRVQRYLPGTAVVSSQDDSRVQRNLPGTAVVSNRDKLHAHYLLVLHMQVNSLILMSRIFVQWP